MKTIIFVLLDEFDFPAFLQNEICNYYAVYVVKDNVVEVDMVKVEITDGFSEGFFICWLLRITESFYRR